VISIINLSGRNVFRNSGQLSSDKLEAKIKSISLSPGLYLVSLSTENESRVQRIAVVFK